ncbi:hypothetical protein [Paraburkholderia sp. LEh10]|uniref:hypothetical protein n=1 Tax=Paraburkholderia sp. LEh10 TaxID=2821353 RepID=UPI001AE785D1|nr:hypothetical protein [Paraburkholderia sp. LEh10]
MSEQECAGRSEALREVSSAGHKLAQLRQTVFPCELTAIDGVEICHQVIGAGAVLDPSSAAATCATSDLLGRVSVG